MKVLSRTLFLTLALLTAPVFPYEVQYADKAQRHPLKWSGRSLELSVSSSLLEDAPNLKGSEESLAAVLRAVRRWEDAAGLSIGVSISEVRSISPRGRTGDGISLLTIAQTPENLILFSGANSSAAAFTRLFYDSKGNITEADIVLNPFFLTSTDGTPGSFDLESTVTHEIGHVIGLGHSVVLGATMSGSSARNGFYGMPFTSPRTLAEDDMAGARYIYGPSGKSENCCAELRGTIVSNKKSGERAFRVWVTESDTGKTVAAVMTNSDGRYSVGGLLASEYQIFAKGEDGASGVFQLGEASPGAGESLEMGPVTSSGDIRLSSERIGFNGQLSAVAVPLNAGSSFRVFVSGKGLDLSTRISVISRYLTVEEDSLELFDYGTDSVVCLFVIEVHPDAPPGDYSVALTDKEGRSDWILGGLTVEKTRNPWAITDF